MGKPVLIGIDGFGASGKTTFAQSLSKQLNDCPVIGIDYFCYPPSQKEGEWWGSDIKGYGYDWERLRDQIIIPATNGEETIRFQELDWDDFELKWAPELQNPKHIIFEGVTILRKELRAFYDLKIWANAPLDTQMERVQERDGGFMLPFWEQEFNPNAKDYFDKHRPDLEVDIRLELEGEKEEILDTIWKKYG